MGELLSRQQAVKGLTVSPVWGRLATQACGQIQRQVTTRHPSGLELSVRQIWRTQECATIAKQYFKCEESPKRSPNAVDGEHDTALEQFQLLIPSERRGASRFHADGPTGGSHGGHIWPHAGCHACRALGSLRHRGTHGRQSPLVNGSHRDRAPSALPLPVSEPSSGVVRTRADGGLSRWQGGNQQPQPASL